MKFTPSSITSLSSCSCAWDSSALKEPHVMVPAQTCVTVMSVVPNLTFFRVVLRFTVAIVSCGAVVDETFSVRERSDVASRFANTFFEKKGGRQASKWHVARPPRSITVCFIANVQFNVVVWLFCAFKAHANSHIHIMDSEFAISLARGFFFASHLTRIRFSGWPYRH